jgi:DNA-binding NarL/FixJ family response regulator
MIVDDNSAFLDVIRPLLEGRELTVVGDATTGAEAIERAGELSPDLILLDVDLGEDSGLNVARQLEQVPGAAVSKVVLISAHPAEDYADLVAETPAIGFLPKSDLSVAAIQELLARHAAAGNHNQRESK